MEFLGAFATLTIFGSMLLFWLSVLGFLIICIASDINRNGFYAFGALNVFVVLTYFWGEVTPLLEYITVANVLIYLGLGFLYASLKTFIGSKKLKNKIKNFPIEKPKEYPYKTKDSAISEFKSDLKGDVFRWWFMWVISMLVWIFKDLIADGWKFVYSKVKYYFNWIVDMAIK